MSRAIVSLSQLSSQVLRSSVSSWLSIVFQWWSSATCQSQSAAQCLLLLVFSVCQLEQHFDAIDHHTHRRWGRRAHTDWTISADDRRQCTRRLWASSEVQIWPVFTVNLWCFQDLFVFTRENGSWTLKPLGIEQANRHFTLVYSSELFVDCDVFLFRSMMFTVY